MSKNILTNKYFYCNINTQRNDYRGIVMKEIMGEKLLPFFRRVGIYPPKKFIGNVGYWHNLEVWHLTDSQFKLIEDITDEEFVNMADEGCWWRSSEGSIMGIPNATFKINKKEILAWINYSMIDDLRREYEELSFEENSEYKNVDDYISTWHSLEYNDLLEYYSKEFGVSTERNVCALSVDLAKYNNMTLAELFYQYGGCKNGKLRGICK